MILGVNGQDGSYLAEHLLSLGWNIYGISRQVESAYIKSHERYKYISFDLLSSAKERKQLIDDIAPDWIFHVAAIHGASGFEYEKVWQQALQVNTATVHDCLEYIRNNNNQARLGYMSSLKVFGSVAPKLINEDNEKIGSCLYSITKNTSSDLIEYYRSKYGIRASIFYVFNHDSPRRPLEFFLPRLCNAVASALKGKGSVKLRSLDFSCDWGSAKEFMQIAIEAIGSEINQDYVIASGKTWIASELVEAIFSHYGLEWQNHLLLEKPAGSEPIKMYSADLSKLKNNLNRIPKNDALEVARWILRENYDIN